jgi:hypothetical protein
LRLIIGQKLLNLVADGVSDASRLRYFTVESLPDDGDPQDIAGLALHITLQALRYSNIRR